MKIRNLQDYIKQWSEVDSLHLLGTDDEPFLSKLNGEETQVDAWIEGSASFANNAQEQLFYEFVQNAFDADADSLMFYMNKDYLIILNNGNPFYTDPRSDKERDGQLYNFLAKGKSQKHNDNSKLGNFGQGSKLLYTLIANTGLESNSELLSIAIKKEKRGPYLISWANDEQLQNFLEDRNKWELGDFKDYQHNMLIAKILMSYYPITPGIDEKLFSKEEISKVVASFNTLVDPRRNINRLRQGTALIVPLGKGQYERINAPENVQHVRERLGDFAAVQGDKPKNKQNKLKYISVFGSEVPVRDVKSIFVTIPVGTKDVEYQICFNPELAMEGVVNFYKALPIHETRYGLGFIIDSENFEVDDSRQRIQDKEKTGQLLEMVFKKLKAELHDKIRTDSSAWDYIYQCLLSTNIPDTADFTYVRDAFNEILRPLLESYVLNTEGSYAGKGNSCYNPTLSALIPLTEIGVSGKHWVSKDVRDKLQSNHGIMVESRSISQILNISTQRNLTNWVLSLSASTYAIFHKEVCKELEKIDRQIFLSNHKHIYSWKELNSGLNIYFLSDSAEKGDFDIFPTAEYVVEKVPALSTADYWTLVFEKLHRNVDSFAKEDAGKELVCGLLVKYKKAMESLNRASDADKVRSFALLTNMHGDRVSFRNLLLSRPDPDSVLFDSFVLKGYCPNNLPKVWCVGKKSLWAWLKNSFDLIKALPDWGTMTKQYLKDIKFAYSCLDEPSYNDRLKLYLDADGIPTSKPCFALSGSKLNLTDYAIATKALSTVDRVFVPAAYREELISAPFELDRLSVQECLSKSVLYDLESVRVFFKATENLLNEHAISKTAGGKFQFTDSKGKNFIDEDLSINVKKVFISAGYCSIPADVVPFLSDDKLTEYNPLNKEVLLDVIESVDDSMELFPLIEKSDSSVKGRYFDELYIDINSQLDESDTRWKIIQFVTKNPEYTENLIKGLTYKKNNLPEEIQGHIITLEDHQYDVYDLLPDVRESNELIEKFLSLLPDPDLFRSFFYDGKIIEPDAEDVYDQLYNEYLTLPQLEYCLDYSILNDADYESLEIDSKTKLSDALEMIYNRKFENFNRWFAIANFNAESQVFADKSLLLRDEYLPSALDKWLEIHEDASSLMMGLMTDETPLVAVRKAIRDNLDYPVDNWEESDMMLRTIKWMCTRTISYGSAAYRTALQFIDKLPDDVSELPLLYFTGNLASADDERSYPVLQMKSSVSNSWYLVSAGLRSELFIEQYVESQKFRDYVSAQKICIVPDSDFLRRHHLKLNARVEANRAAQETKDCHEWDGVLYDKWKEAYPKYRILLSDKDIAITFTLSMKEDVKYQDDVRNAEFGYNNNTDYNGSGYIIVRSASNTKQIINNLKVCKDEECLAWFRPAYIELCDLLLTMIEEKQDVDELLSPSYTPSSGGKASGKGSVKSKGNLQVPDDMLDAVKGLMGKLSAEELSVINERMDDIKKALQVMDEEEPASKVRATIGYIGEQIYDRYLEKRGIEHEYVADPDGQKVGEYDFLLKGEKEPIYVDVKTNLYSLEDGTAPFYIHRSQSAFMQKNPDAKFCIVRVSLKDINIEKEYERLKGIYGAEADPATNSKLQDACKKIADRYWQGATIETFDAKSPEYGLTITRH